tara:strand:- start:41065 stop:44040 length:2976 start_codon:yes stop_codon:yes gene_type:complete
MADDQKFKFISPGIFLNEIDRSQIPALPDAVGPAIIGRSQKGPAFAPTKVNSFSEFTNIFGLPIPGNQQSGDVWREGSQTAPLYAAYAAQAYLAAGVSPVTFTRLLGKDNDDAASSEITLAEAGWQTTTVINPDYASTTAGAYGLLYFGSSSAGALKGYLAATFYMSGCAIFPSGAMAVGSNTGATLNAATEGMNKVIDIGTSKEFTLVLSGSDASTRKYEVSMEVDSPNFVRNVFNTNPELGKFDRNRVVTSVENPSNEKEYWLGESYERTIQDKIFAAHSNYAVAVVPLMSASIAGPANRRTSYRDALTPWVIAQDTTTNTASYNANAQQKLFRFASLDGQGEYANRGIKISIDNINYSPNDNIDYGTFDILIRDSKDSDLNPTVLERFSGCNLDPLSTNYIINKIGDQFKSFDSVSQTMRTYGNIPNNSNFVRAIVDDVVAAGDTPAYIPFGYYGVPKFEDVTGLTTGSSATTTYIRNGGFLSGAFGAGPILFASGVLAPPLGGFDGTFDVSFPTIPQRASSSAGGTDHLSAYFGVSTTKTATSTVYNPGYVDYTRFMGINPVSDGVWGDNYGIGTTLTGVEFEYGFSLDEIILGTGSNYSFSGSPIRNISEAAYTSGSRASGLAFNSNPDSTPGQTSYKNIIDAGVNRFTLPMFGGFDGFSVYERDPVRNNLMDGRSENETTNYVINTYQHALDILTDTESYEFNAICAPGLWYESLTKNVIDLARERGDALGVIDLKGGYIPRHELYYASETSRGGDVQQVMNNIDSRNLNNSYGAAYYPWVTIRDDVNSTFLKTPPSVVALGVLANTERVADVWFAPAGFNRGGLSQGAGGLPVVSTDGKMTARDRDNLYSRQINPIASFPSEGVVIFGQKTLQATQSALDRINVRRLLIYVKKGISQISSTVLFEQNVQSTWNDFKSRADGFLGDVKVRFGVDDFRVVLDSTTTTPDLVDRNIMYAKIFIKPTRSIEYIALDFIITRSGASFDD